MCYRSENYSVLEINCIYDQDSFSQAYGEIVSCFGQSTKDNTLQPCITQTDCTTPDNYAAKTTLGKNLYGFDERYHQDFATSQPIKVKFEFSSPFHAAKRLTGYALLLTIKILSNSSDRQSELSLICF